MTSHKIKFKAPLPDRASLIAFNAVSEVRASLDQSVYAVAVASGRTDPKSAYFPVAESAEGLETVIKGRCKDVPQEFVSFLRGFKPYNGGNNLIWAINRISNMNKHKILAPMAIMLGPRIGFGNLGVGVRVLLPPRWDRENHEITYAESMWGADVRYEIEFSADIGFDDVPSLYAMPAVHVLQQAIRLCGSIIDGIEAEAHRLHIFGH